MTDISRANLEIGEILAAGFAPIKSHFWKLLLWVGIPYFLLSVILVGGALWTFFWKFLPVFTTMLADKNANLSDLQPLAWSYAGIILIAFVPSSFASAALFRFHSGAGLKGRFFAFRFGADEIRQYVILWLMILVTIIVPTGIVVAGIVLANKANSETLVVSLSLLAVFLLPIVMVYLGVRFSLVLAQTYAEKKLRFFGSWRLTRGHFWVLFLTFAVLVVVFALLSMFFSAPANLIFYMQPSTGWLGDPEILKSLDSDDINGLFRETFLSTTTLMAFGWAVVAGSMVNIFQIVAFNGASLFVYQHAKDDTQGLSEEVHSGKRQI